MPDQPSPAQQIIGDFAPKLVELADDQEGSRAIDMGCFAGFGAKVVGPS